jgi:potassium-transporting ATPase KdpC subunit
MWKQICKATVILITFTVLLGIVYPLTVTGISLLVFPKQANGSIIYKNGQPLGSALIGQNFSAPIYFHGRPSSAGADGYDATSSSGSNLGPTNEKLIGIITKRAEQLRIDNGLKPGSLVPADLVTASGSGLDPHISPASAFLQVGRVARARNLPEEQIQELVENSIGNQELGILGEPRVNVLQLNLALDALITP